VEGPCRSNQGRPLDASSATPGRLRDRTVELQQHRASGLTLVTAAIALWNTVYLGRAVKPCAASARRCPTRRSRTSPRSGGSTSTSPATTSGAGDALGQDGFRLLRGERHTIADAA
jgi:hypothetical protein